MIRNIYADPNWILFYEGSVLRYKMPFRALKLRERATLIERWVLGLKTDFPTGTETRKHNTPT
jgi:hypothetical protein